MELSYEEQQLRRRRDFLARSLNPGRRIYVEPFDPTRIRYIGSPGSFRPLPRLAPPAPFNVFAPLPPPQAIMPIPIEHQKVGGLERESSGEKIPMPSNTPPSVVDQIKALQEEIRSLSKDRFQIIASSVVTEEEKRIYESHLRHLLRKLARLYQQV